MSELQKITVKGLLSNENIKARFQEILKDNAAGFCANLAVMVNNNAQLSKCEPMSVVSAAVVSASLNLPLDPNLGFAAIVPFGDKATFQIMYKGIIQLAQRSGQFKRIDFCSVHEGDTDEDVQKRLRSVLKAKPETKVIGYASYFELINGFESFLYMSNEDLKKHGMKYSQTFKKGFGLWKDDFEAMAVKTVIKLLLKRNAPLSIEMQRAIITDQAVVKGVAEDAEVEYIDNMQIQAEVKDAFEPKDGKLL